MRLNQEFYLSEMKTVRYRVVGFDDKGRAMFVPIEFEHGSPMPLHSDQPVFLA